MSQNNSTPVIHAGVDVAKAKLDLSLAARNWLAARGYDPVYGARPLKRAIQQQLENPLAQRILKGEFGPGDTVRVVAADGGLGFTQ